MPLFVLRQHDDASRLWISWCLIVNQERELEFKIAVTAGLQDKNSMYITQENLLCFHFMIIIEE